MCKDVQGNIIGDFTKKIRQRWRNIWIPTEWEQQWLGRGSKWIFQLKWGFTSYEMHNSAKSHRCFMCPEYHKAPAADSIPTKILSMARIKS